MTDETSRPVHVGAVVVRDGAALFVRQTPSYSLGAVWSIPWGRLQAGETPSSAALRETTEEAGVVAKLEGLIAVQSLPEPWEGTLALVYLCAHAEGEPTADGVETDAARYLPLEELRDSKEQFEPWCRWLAVQVLEGHTRALRRAEGNPFGAEGFISLADAPLAPP